MGNSTSDMDSRNVIALVGRALAPDQTVNKSTLLVCGVLIVVFINKTYFICTFFNYYNQQIYVYVIKLRISPVPYKACSHPQEPLLYGYYPLQHGVAISRTRGMESDWLACSDHAQNTHQPTELF